MDNKTTFGIGLLIGAIAGAVGGYFYTRYKLVDDMAATCEQMRSYYELKYDVSTPESEEKGRPEPEAADGASKIGYVAKAVKQEDMVDYTKPSRPTPFRVETEIVEDENGKLVEAAYGVPDEEENTEPYSIDPDTFDRDDEYKKLMLTWYEKNRVMAYDSNPHITIDPEMFSELFGNFEEHFGDWERDTVYIRNEVEKTDYEIDACITDYYAMIKVVRDDRGDDD